MGMMLGAKALPENWTAVMNDTIHTDLSGYQTTKISKLAEEMFQIHQSLGKVKNHNCRLLRRSVARLINGHVVRALLLCA